MSARVHGGWTAAAAALATAVGIGVAAYERATSVPQHTVDEAIMSLLDELRDRTVALAVCEARVADCCTAPAGFRRALPPRYDPYRRQPWAWVGP